MQDSDAAGAKRGRGVATLDPFAAGLDAPEFHVGIVGETRKDSHCVAAAADASDYVTRQTPVTLQNLPARFVTDDSLEFAHHVRIRMRADDAADDVESVFDALGPDPEGFIGCILEGLRAALDRVNRRAEQSHHVNVEGLAFDVARAHVDVDRQTELRADRRRCHAVLTGSRLCDQSLFSHAHREQRLSDRIVDLVRSGMVGIFALHQQRRRRNVGDVPLAPIERRRPADEIAQHRVIFVPKPWVAEALSIARSSCSSAAISTSGTNRPPNSPK